GGSRSTAHAGSATRGLVALGANPGRPLRRRGQRPHGFARLPTRLLVRPTLLRHLRFVASTKLRRPTRTVVLGRIPVPGAGPGSYVGSHHLVGLAGRRRRWSADTVAVAWRLGGRGVGKDTGLLRVPLGDPRLPVARHAGGATRLGVGRIRPESARHHVGYPAGAAAGLAENGWLP